MSRYILINNYIKNINALNNTRTYLNGLIKAKKISIKMYYKLWDDTNVLLQKWDQELKKYGVEKRTIKMVKQCIW